MEDVEAMLRVFLMAAAAICIGRLLWISRRPSKKYPPVVPGRPIVGNLLQLREKKPHHTFTKWARNYGPIYSIRTGATPMVVLNSSQLAKEAMVTKFTAISSRKLPNALRILTREKTMVAMSDYGDYHRMAKKMVLTNLLGAAAQKQKNSHFLRESMLQSIINNIHSQSVSTEGVNLRQIFINELFPFALKAVIGRDIESVYVEEIGSTLSKWEIYEILVVDPMKGAIQVDWRDFFPYLRWVPYRDVEERMKRMDRRRNAVLRTLIEEQKRLLDSGKEPNCYLDILLKEAPQLTEKQLEMSIWEPIIEASDTTLVTVEWAMFELSKNPHSQDRLYRELQRVSGDKDVTEDYLPKLPYLSAVFQETLRKHPPVPILPLRYVHEDVELGGFHVPAGSQIAINIYGCHNDEKEWENPEEWKPERFDDELQSGEVLDVKRTMAFGAGKRACAGTLQATLIACTAIARFVQRFNWELAAGEEDSTGTVTLTTHKLHPLKAIVTPRSMHIPSNISMSNT
jgi:ent-kaurene oxidase